MLTRVVGTDYRRRQRTFGMTAGAWRPASDGRQVHGPWSMGHGHGWLRYTFVPCTDDPQLIVEEVFCQ